jgi:hypothetical protein
MATTRVKPRREHLDVAREADLSKVSIVSVIAGLVSAYGVFAVVAAIVGAVLNSLDVATEFRTNDWTGSGAAAGLATAFTLFVAYLFGGYVAGRMARRAGVLHGIIVFVASLVVGAAVSGVVTALSDDAVLKDNLRSIGIPTTWDQVSGVAIASIIASIAAMLIGAAFGGALGERWHTKLARRVADPSIGPAAESRKQAEREDEERQRRLDRDQTLSRDVRDQDRHDDTDVYTDADRDHDRERERVLDLEREHEIEQARREQSEQDLTRLGGTHGADSDQPRYTADEWRRLESQDPSLRNR